MPCRRCLPTHRIFGIALNFVQVAATDFLFDSVPAAAEVVATDFLLDAVPAAVPFVV